MKTKKGLELRSVGGEQIVVASGIENIDFTKIISMNASSAYLWEQIQGKDFSVETLVDLLVSHYDVEPTIAARDAEIIAQQWFDAGIIEVEK